MARSPFSKSEAGFSLAEVIVATGILTAAVVSLAQLFALATQSNTTARDTTLSTVLAEQKLEQLRALTWGFDSIGLPMTDTTTNTGVYPEEPFGGTGLSPSPATALQENTPGYVDYLDRWGGVVGHGTAVPAAGTIYTRRWSVEPLPTNPNNTLILQVLVTRRADRGLADQGNVTRLPDEARIITVKTRKAQ